MNAEKKLIGIFVCTLMILTTVLPVAATMNINIITTKNNLGYTNVKDQIPVQTFMDGWGLQWIHAYGGYGHSQLAQPIGDLDGDGVNEVIVGGYSTYTTIILHYNPTTKTYESEYEWSEAGGTPSGACIADLDKDGTIELIVSWEYGSLDGIYVYHWDGTTLTDIDYYSGTGIDFVFDVYTCDYNDDGNIEVLIANAPNMGTGPYHVTGLGWEDNNLFWETSWTCPGGSSMECPMVWSGDVDDDSFTEIIADVSQDTTGTAGTWALNWNETSGEWDGVPVCTNYPSGTTVYGDSVGDMDGDGTPEIGIGSYGGVPGGWLFEWDGSTFQQVWHKEYSGQQPTIEAIAIGDADNDGINELCWGTGFIHIIQWDGTAYVEEATFTDPTGMLAGMNVGDCDSDGLNEVKACEILSGTGSEFIYKYYDETPPVTTCELSGEMEDDSFISDVTVFLNATDDHSAIDYTNYKLDSDDWKVYDGPFVVSEDGTHTLKFYSVDTSGNIEDDKSVIFTIKNPCCFDVIVPKGISIGLKVKIKELCNASHTDVTWSFEIAVGKLKAITPLNGTFDIKAGKTKTIRSPLVFGFGRIHLLVNVDDCKQLSKYGFVIGSMVIIS